MCAYTYMYIYTSRDYGVTSISRLLKIIGLYCSISSLLYGSFAKETFDFKEPINRSHPIVVVVDTMSSDIRVLIASRAAHVS